MNAPRDPRDRKPGAPPDAPTGSASGDAEASDGAAHDATSALEPLVEPAPAYRPSMAPPPPRRAQGALELHPWDAVAEVETPLRSPSLPPRWEPAPRGPEAPRRVPSTAPAARVPADTWPEDAVLLRDLAQHAEGDARADLLVAAALELRRAGEHDDARALLDEAVGDAPTHRVSLRMLRHDALMRRDLEDVVRVAEREAMLDLSREDRAELDALLAWARHLGHASGGAVDPPRTRATEPRGRSWVRSVLEAHRNEGQGDAARAAQLLGDAAEHTTHRGLASALLSDAAHAVERASEERGASEPGGGGDETAEALFARALELDPRSLDARLGVARAAWARGARAVVSDVLAGGQTHAAHGRERDAFAWLGAELRLAGGDADKALALTAASESLAAVWTRGRAAERTQGRGEARRAMETVLARGTRGWARIFAELELIEGALERGDRATARDLAASLLRRDDAADALHYLATLHGLTMDELAATETTQGARLSPRDAAELTAQALLHGDAARQADALLQARASGLEPNLVRALSFTTLSAGGRLDALGEVVEESESRGAAPWLLGVRLGLAAGAEAQRRTDDALAHLRRAAAAHGQLPAIALMTALAIQAERPRDAAAELLRCLEHAPSELAASLATLAARWVLRGGGDPEPALGLALDEVPRFPPAVWLLSGSRTVRGATRDLAELLVDAGRHAPAPFLRAAQLVQAALLHLGHDRAQAAALLEEALAAYGDDAFLFEMALTYGTQLGSREKAALLERGLDRGDSAWNRALALRAASHWGAAGEFERAASLYRRFSSAPDLLAQRGLDRIEVAMGELARVAARRFADLKHASGNGPRLAALESLLDLDRFERDDASAALASVHAILEIDPRHTAALRALVTAHMNAGRLEDAGRAAEQLLPALVHPPDVLAYLRFAARSLLARGTETQEWLDRMVLAHWRRAAPDLWLVRQTIAAARRQGDPRALAEATEAAARLLPEGPEHAESLRLAADAWLEAGDRDHALRCLRVVVERYPMHPDAGEPLATLLLEAGAPRDAAEALEATATWSSSEARTTHLWYRAARIWQDHVRDRQRTRACLEHVVDTNPRHEDAYDRLAALLLHDKDLDRLREVTEARIEAGGENPVLAALFETLASTHEALGEEDAALRALRRSAVLDPDRVGTWRRLEAKYRDRGDWRGTVDALIHVARLERDPNALRETFLSLGDIYGERLVDFPRAEGAYQRAAALGAGEDVDERLARVYRRAGNHERTLEVLDALVREAPSREKRVAHVVEKARALEAMGDLRGAEQTLEQERRETPTDVALIDALSDLYERRGAKAALALHLGRAADDLRHAFIEEEYPPATLPHLVELLRRRGRKDAARVVASVSTALGTARVDFADLLDEWGSVPGARTAALDAGLLDVLLPPLLPRAALEAFGALRGAPEGAFPINLSLLGAHRIPSGDPRYRDAIAEAASILGRELTLFESEKLPRVCVPLRAKPLEILVGRQLLESTTDAERVFLWLRTGAAAVHGLTPALRLDTEELALLVEATLHALEIPLTPAPRTRVMQAVRAQVERALPKRDRALAKTLWMELSGAPGFSPANLAEGAAHFGSRAALLATGHPAAGLGALFKMAGIPRPMAGRPDVRRSALLRVPEARALVQFALSEEHFDLRARTGAGS